MAVKKGKLTTKKLDDLIAAIYRNHCHGPINIFNISKIYKAGQDAYKPDEPYDVAVMHVREAVIAAFAQFKEPEK